VSSDITFPRDPLLSLRRPTFPILSPRINKRSFQGVQQLQPIANPSKPFSRPRLLGCSASNAAEGEAFRRRRREGRGGSPTGRGGERGPCAGRGGGDDYEQQRQAAEAVRDIASSLRFQCSVPYVQLFRFDCYFLAPIFTQLNLCLVVSNGLPVLFADYGPGLQFPPQTQFMLACHEGDLRRLKGSISRFRSLSPLGPEMAARFLEVLALVPDLVRALRACACAF
jgi:hypothetical protein